MSKTFDGMHIDEWGGRFSGSFDLEEEQASRHSVDDVVVMIVRAQIKGANVKTTPQGDVKRLHIFGVEDARFPSNKLWRQCMTELRPDRQGKLELQNPDDSSSAADELEPDEDVIHVEGIEAVLEHLPTQKEQLVKPGGDEFGWTDEQPPVQVVPDLLPKDPLLREFLSQ